jgi:hypothetical protein
MSKLTQLALLTAIVALPAAAQGVKITEDKPGLMKKAKITAEAATTAALAKVPGGKVEKGELEEEDGKLIFSFDIKVAGKSGIEEVAVDAITGKVLSVEHESPAAEKKEQEQDEKAAKAKAAAKPAAKKP